jgi:hypothetical protein
MSSESEIHRLCAPACIFLRMLPVPARLSMQERATSERHDRMFTGEMHAIETLGGSQIAIP